jgi:TolB-like protein/Tfp pilus assembly protein PilF
VVVLGVGVAAASVAWRLRAGPGLDRPATAIAVLPFDNLSGDPDQEFFSDGMTEQVIVDLGRIKALRVIARGSVMHYKAHPKPPAAAAKELGVGALVDGSVLRVGDRVRVTAQLIAPDDGRVLWSDSFDRDARDILAMQAEIATTIARQVRATVAPDEARSLAAAYSPNPKAHELYLLGRYHAYRKNPQSAKKSVDYLVEATRLDPGFALAYASLAEAYRLREIWGGVAGESYAEESRRAANQALALDPALAEAHLAMAIFYSQREWNWSAADAEFARAIAARPSLSDAHAEFSFHLQGLGRYEEGVAAARRAVLLDPLSPDHLSQHGRALFRARRYPEAIESFKKALEIDPNFGSALSRLIDVYLVTGQYAAAEPLLQKRREALGEASVQAAQLYAKTGRLTEARALMMSSRNAAGGGIGFGPALVAVALGQHDEALDSIERAVRARRLTAFSLRDPRFDPIVSSPRFRQVLRDMNLPE